VTIAPRVFENAGGATERIASVSDVVVLRVNQQGEVIDANAAGAGWMLRSGSRCCHRVVGANGIDGEHVCVSQCAGALASGLREDRNPQSVVVRGELTRLECHRLGDEVVVVAQRTGEPAPHARQLLTRREIEVLEYVAEGYTTSQIAARLGIRPATVRTHVEHALGRLGVHTRAEAISKAISTGQLTARAAEV